VYNAYAVGKRVYLRHPTEDDLEGRWHEWLSDEETTKSLAARRWPNSRDTQREFYEAAKKSRDRLVLSIVDIETDGHIGVCSLSGIDWVHRYADIAVVIGESEFRSGPFVADALTLLLKIAFLRLNLRIVKGGYMSSNLTTEAIMKVFRFKEVGRFEGLFWCDGTYVDSVLVMLDRETWMKRNSYVS
jgi:[ribosomal protein S5]-alanine N-acetyltransferase